MVKVPILNPAAPRPEALDGFVEANGYVSIEAEHYSRAVAPRGREWKRIPDHGRTLSGMTRLAGDGGARTAPRHAARVPDVPLQGGCRHA